MFDPKTGFYVRSGVYDENGNDTGIDPFMTQFPELIDVGVMGHCVHGASGLCLKSGVQCYQNGLKTHMPNMSLENYKRIVDECKDKTFQFALGGRGDVDQHENFEEIMRYTRENGIVPNFTSSGLGFTPEIVDICNEMVRDGSDGFYHHSYEESSNYDLIKEIFGVKTANKFKKGIKKGYKVYCGRISSEENDYEITMCLDYLKYEDSDIFIDASDNVW